MTRPFDYVALADRINAHAETLPMNPTYPDATARRLYDAHEREERRRLTALCDAPVCGWCGWLAPNHDPRCQPSEDV